MALKAHGDGNQIVWANGKWIVVTDTLAAADVVSYVFEEAAAGGAVAPTSVLYGPLGGPLAGPI